MIIHREQETEKIWIELISTQTQKGLDEVDGVWHWSSSFLQERS